MTLIYHRDSVHRYIYGASSSARSVSARWYTAVRLVGTQRRVPPLQVRGGVHRRGDQGAFRRARPRSVPIYPCHHSSCLRIYPLINHSSSPTYVRPVRGCCRCRGAVRASAPARLPVSSRWTPAPHRPAWYAPLRFHGDETTSSHARTRAAG